MQVKRLLEGIVPYARPFSMSGSLAPWPACIWTRLNQAIDVKNMMNLTDKWLIFDVDLGHSVHNL